MTITDKNVTFQSGDDLNEDNLRKLLRILTQHDGDGFIHRGLTVTADHVNDNIDVDEGAAVITDDTGEGAYAIEHPGLTGASVANQSGMNYIFLTIDPTVDNDVTVEINSSDSPNRTPALKIAEVDTLNDQEAVMFNVEKSESFDTLSTNSISSSSASIANLTAGSSFTDPQSNTYSGALPTWLDGLDIAPNSVDAGAVSTPSLNSTIKYVTTESQLQAMVGAGNTLIIPAGTTINVSDPVVLGDNDHLQIESGATLRQADGSNLTEFRTVVRTHGTNILVDGGGTIDANVDGQSGVGYRGLGDVQGSGPYANIRVQNVTIQNCGERKPVEFGFSSDVWVTNCTFGGGAQFDTGAVAVEARNGDITNFHITDNTIKPLHSTLSGDCIFIDSITNSGHKVRRFVISNNTFEGSWATRTSSESGVFWGILVEEGGQSGVISENSLRAESGDGSGGGIYLNSQTGAGGTGTITVTGNTLRGDSNATQPGGASINGIVIGTGVLCNVSSNLSISFSGNGVANNSANAVVVGNHTDGTFYDSGSGGVVADNL
ncbi:hypothetical protein SAMN05421858_5055 [Haladaptatus litoreus]|uniref:Right handed beta helix region n=1 Tax=Haladaptatus litoreus TaxID=553468 RepID=A0A1N7FH82_9EURY|nr:hypothetical protein [Haladaptatus litoreus]SIR99712.1 hypothetical protein SAMN05421858_5055 [Haladaptatus litoreus]